MKIHKNSLNSKLFGISIIIITIILYHYIRYYITLLTVVGFQIFNMNIRPTMF